MMQEIVKADEAPLPLQEEAALPPKPPLPLNTSTISLSTDREQLITPKRKPKKCSKCRKIFFCILLLIIILLIAVVLFFALYIFKKRQLQFTPSSPTLESFSYSIIPPIMLNLVMGVDIGIKNPNYAGFKYQSTNMTFFYHRIETGMSPMPADVVKSRSSKKIHNTVYINATTMISSQYFLPELISGRLPLSTRTYMVGKATLFNLVKIHMTILINCNITINVLSTTTKTDCKADVKIL
jgi:hypothetical protein